MNQRITPYLPVGRKTYMASFVNANDKRVNRSLNTSDRLESLAICHELEGLARRDLPSVDPVHAGTSDIAYRLWYDDEKPNALTASAGTALDTFDANKMRERLRLLEIEVARLNQVEKEYLALLGSVDGARMQALLKSPKLGDVEKAYRADLKKLAREGGFNKTVFDEMIRRWKDRKIASIKASEISDWLDEDAKKKEPGRRNRMRAHVSRFFSWAELHHSIPSPLGQVSTDRAKATKDIEWRSLEEVEALLATLDPYWAGMVAVMAFAGLSAHEVRGLRKTDFSQGKKGEKSFLRVTPTDERGLKTAARQRSVAVSTRLAPYLSALIAGGYSNEYLFPAPSGEQWKPDYLTKCLGGWLPEGWTALTLRRTFGSLLIRSGKSETEVAAAMGNSPMMVRRHYGRLLGGEVDLDF